MQTIIYIFFVRGKQIRYVILKKHYLLDSIIEYYNNYGRKRSTKTFYKIQLKNLIFKKIGDTRYCS